MFGDFKKRKHIRFTMSLLITLMLIFLFAWGCKDYDDISTETDNSLINAATLKGWDDKGMINNTVVILDVTNSTNYEQGHISGAQLLSTSELTEDREEGVTIAKNMVLSGPKMDALLQKFGVDEKTTIVFTTSLTSIEYPCRAYFTFRYWGFPKERLKILNGFNQGWALTTEKPDIKPTTYNVKKLNSFDPDQRFSLSEMINAVKNKTGLPWDTRSNGVPSGPTTTSQSDPTKYVTFEGTIKGAKSYNNTNLWDSTSMTFYDINTIIEKLKGADLDGSTGITIYPYCSSGLSASIGYFVLDGILGWKARLYDGSWRQWGQMSPESAGQGGVLPDKSPWITDSDTLTDGKYYNNGQTTSSGTTLTTSDIETISIIGFGTENKIEIEDAQYSGGAGGSSSQDTAGSAPAAGYGG